MVPEQFSWVDQALVQRHLIDRCDSSMAALYLFLITVADAQGLSYYGAATLSARLRLSAEQLTLARTRLIELGLIAYQAPLVPGAGHTWHSSCLTSHAQASSTSGTVNRYAGIRAYPPRPHKPGTTP